MTSLAGSEVRLAELVASMSLATDLGLGQPMEHVLRSCVLGLRIAEHLGLGDDERAVVYYVALLAWLGCHADAHEQSGWFGDDIELRADRHLADTIGVRFLLGHVGRGEPAPRRALRLGSLLVAGRDAVAAMEATHCIVAGQFAMRLGLGTEVRDGLQHVFERWDGRGAPAGIAGEQIALSARIVVIADIVETFRRLGGTAAAVDVARRRAGGQFDPGLAGLVRENADALLAGSTRPPAGTRRSGPSRRSPAGCRARSSTRRSWRSPTSPTSSRPTPPVTRAGSPSARPRPRGGPGSEMRPRPS